MHITISKWSTHIASPYYSYHLGPFNLIKLAQRTEKTVGSPCLLENRQLHAPVVKKQFFFPLTLHLSICFLSTVMLTGTQLDVPPSPPATALQHNASRGKGAVSATLTALEGAMTS